MKVVQINTVCGRGSTGKICVGISEMLNKINVDNYILYSQYQSSYPNGIKCVERLPKLQALKSRVIGNYGFNSNASTRKIISELEKINPDIVHLHNLHGHNCNIALLMKYFRDNKTKVIWTFHDCWAFTGYCPHFTMAGCDHWREGCGNCPQSKNYSWFFDRSREMYDRKRNFTYGVNLTIVTPSQWLATLVKDSFFKDFPIKIIYNGIDLTTFTERKSDFREKYGFKNKFIVLGVADKWGKRKGLDVFVDLSRMLPSEKYQILLVGTDEKIDKILPDRILSIHRTQDQRELAELYTLADVFVNPTREEVLGLTNVEALACGTPVITFNTGGSPECIDESCGYVVNCNDTEDVKRKIEDLSEAMPFSKESCIKRAVSFDMNIKFEEYIDLYLELIK